MKVQSSWTLCLTDGDLVRKETYINPLKKNSLGPREAFCIDQQRCIHRSTSGFVLERKVYTPQVCNYATSTPNSTHSFRNIVHDILHKADNVHKHSVHNLAASCRLRVLSSAWRSLGHTWLDYP